MNKIIKKEQLSELVFRLRLEAPRIAKKREAGQFVILRPLENSERIPLTIANANREEGWIEIIFQRVGSGTIALSELSVGEYVHDLAGPLGRPTHIENFGKVVCIGGGVGIAPLYPITAALKAAGNDVTVILGARSKDILILEDEMAATSDNLFIATDDGTKGHKGFVSDVFNNLVDSGEKFDLAVVIGPAIMMKVTTSLTVGRGVKTYASLNPIMVDGTGMCGSCRVSVFGETKFACVDGPEFDAAGIDWDLLLKRLNSFKGVSKDHACKIGR